VRERKPDREKTHGCTQRHATAETYDRLAELLAANSKEEN
jgi:hypothetical protein